MIAACSTTKYMMIICNCNQSQLCNHDTDNNSGFYVNMTGQFKGLLTQLWFIDVMKLWPVFFYLRRQIQFFVLISSPYFSSSFGHLT